MLFALSKKNYLFFHIITEFSSILIAWSLFVVIWNTRGIAKNDSMLFIGIAYLFIGWLDFLHVLSYKGMGIFDIQSEANTATQLWVVSRYIESITLAIFPFLFHRRLPLPYISILYICTTAFVSYIILAHTFFPDCFIEGVGLTTFKIYSEYTIIALLCSSLFSLYIKRHLIDQSIIRYLAISIAFTIAAEMAFTIYADVYGFSNVLGHILKIFSFYFIYRALIKIGLKDPYEQLFKEINESESRYRQMFETNKAIQLLVDPSNGKIIKANESACSYYGYTKEQFDSLYITDITSLPPNEVKEEMRRAKNKNKLVFSFPHKLANGEIRDVEVYSGPIEYKNKIFLYSIVHDITDRNRATSELEVYAEDLFSIFNSVPNVLILLDKEGRVEMINHEGASFVGKEKGEVLGKLGGDLLDCLNTYDGQECGRSPDCAACPIRNAVESTFESGTWLSDIECAMTLIRNGKEKVFNFLISTSIIDHKKEKKVLLSITDVSLLKDKEKEISFQAYLLNQIQDQVVVTKLDGEIIYVNEASCKAIDRAQIDIIGQPVHLYGEHPSRGATQNEIIQNTLKNGEWRGEVYNYSSNGQEFIMNLRTKLLRDSSGNATTMLGVSTDITDQKTIGKQLEQAQKMEVMGTLAGGIAHDFNNILAPILGYSEMLLEEIPAENESVIDSLKQIHLSAMRASDLVKQILTFSRQKDTEFKPIKIQIILKEAVKLIGSTIPKNIEVTQDIDDSCRAVNADVTQVHQVIMNLLTNAFHAIGNTEGKITVTYSKQKQLPQEVSENKGFYSNFVCLEVKDTGTGIPADTIKKVFDPFFTTKEQGKGTGMGLSVAHGIVKNMNGHILVKSEFGHGTVFSIYLPMEHGLTVDEEVRDKSDLPRGSEHILLIDDEEPILEMLQRMLERLGYRVYPRSSPIEALEAFRNSPDKFDLVITDMSMPLMSGDKLGSELLKIRPNLPIILNTGFSEKITLSFLKDMGFREVLMKPVVRKELAATLRKVLDKNVH